MANILEWYREYLIEYDVVDKILILRRPIGVAEFVMLKEDLKKIKEKVLDIRVI